MLICAIDATICWMTTATQHHYNQTSETSKSKKLLNQVPRGPAPFASFDSITSIDITTPEDRKTPTNYQGMFMLYNLHLY